MNVDTVMYSLHRKHIVDDVVPHICLVCTMTNSENRQATAKHYMHNNHRSNTVSVNIHLHITQ